MQEEGSTPDLRERLELIESMIVEGRRQTESWGWTFVLWGVALYVADAWATWGRSSLAWPVTMLTAFVLTMVIGSRKGRGQPGTTVGRAIVATWICVGISMLLLFPALGISGRLGEHSFVALLGAMLGMANGTSAIILKWKAQLACAGVWWATAVAACFGSGAQVAAAFLATVFVCQIVFGVYAMILESRRRRQAGVAHG